MMRKRKMRRNKFSKTPSTLQNKIKISRKTLLILTAVKRKISMGRRTPIHSKTLSMLREMICQIFKTIICKIN